MSKKLIVTSEASDANNTVKQMDKLFNFFPMNRCRELVDLITKEKLIQCIPIRKYRIDRREEDAYMATLRIQTNWLAALHRARLQAGDKSVRLDELLLPPVELHHNAELHRGMDWFEWLASYTVLMANHVRELMALFVANMIPIFEKELALHPGGIDLNSQGLIVLQDAEGFYLKPEIKK